MRRSPVKRGSTIMLIWVLIRVSAIMAGWLVFFLVVFLGYLTLPLIVLGGFVLILTAMDIYRWYRRRQAERKKAAENQ